MATWTLYLAAIAAAALISFALTPLVRALGVRFRWIDEPSSSVKTHKVATPSMGGIAIYAAFTLTLLLLRYWTQFPTGTLRSLRALLIGGTLVFFLGIVDDLSKPIGLGFRSKFLVQGLAAALLILFDIRLHFLTPDYLAMALTLLWVVGITNAFNIIDIMDGLSASQAAIAALCFLMISLPSEELYVNFASAALAGSALGFIPWNMSGSRKIFMGDSGSMLLGFMLAGIALGTKYSEVNNLGVYAPLLILLVPMYDTFFVMILRLKQGQSPFLGSRDHFALRLEKVGYSRSRIVLMAAAAAGFLGFCSFLVTQLTLGWALGLYVMILGEILILSRALAQVTMRD
ncbi:MAG: undecaprenyl/decaprenyl-phosphate alpha-N-acetylglucosaminyl 1-phosphate transferase [Elusimicrobia bacterium]|nr:undecaprenyl/decaprenyl-phosphate alpha-N-acetylglucosaminyl 1-phosphate transferase [Elusimicrobiota bacterium]